MPSNRNASRKPSQTLRRRASRTSVNLKPSRSSKRQSTRLSSSNSVLLLELGTEEIPAFFIQPALQQLAQLTEKFLKGQRLEYESIRPVGSSRRLTVIVSGLAPKQVSVSQEVMGPPQAVAFDQHGVPTKAAIGFASTQAVPVESLQVRETPKGKYVCAVKHETGQKTAEVLRIQLPQIIQQLSFKKSMVWNDSNLRFARPLRWVVALYGNKPIRFEVGGVASGAQTYGHRYLSAPGLKTDARITVTDPSKYEAMMKRHRVIVDPQERRALIQDQVSQLAKSAKGKVYGEHYDELLEQAVYTVEYPHAILGSFDSHFLTLPQEVLITAMKEHQGYFSLIARSSALLPKFITVTNMKLPKMDVIRKGNERVLTARLSDAQYFFQEDRKVSLNDRVERLRGITFHKKLGSLHQKVARLQELVPSIADLAGRGDLKVVCERAAFLSKSDLTTGLVGEFPTLQGVMGREYAKHDGEHADVCAAIGELYLPGTPEGVLPENPVGMFLGLGDRIDTLVAFFTVGMIPSGSEDPFALRRIGYGLIRIIVEKTLRLNLVDLIDNAEQVLKRHDVIPMQDLPNGPILLEFLLERFRFFAKTVHQLRDDMIEAVLGARPTESCDITDLLARIQALQMVAAQPEFSPLIVGYTRANRIVNKEQWRAHQVKAELFEHESEIQLHQAVSQAQPLIMAHVAQQDYRAALMRLLQLKAPIDSFFEGVMVNAADQRIRANRLSLLRTIDQLFLTVADFSRIQH